MQSVNMPPDLAASSGSKTGHGEETERFTDWGGDFGGPILKDRWWFWGAYGEQDIRIIKMAGVKDRTLLKNASFKTQGQLTKSMRGSFTFFQAGKQKWGRNAGAFCDAGLLGGPGTGWRTEPDVEGRGQLQHREQHVPRRALRAREGRVLADPRGRHRLG